MLILYHFYPHHRNILFFIKLHTTYLSKNQKQKIRNKLFSYREYILNSIKILNLKIIGGLHQMKKYHIQIEHLTENLWDWITIYSNSDTDALLSATYKVAHIKDIMLILSFQ